MPELRLLCLDTSLTSTGYAVFVIDVSTFSFKLVEYNVVDSSETDFGDATDSRSRHLIAKVSLLMSRHKINAVVTEEPSATIYGWKNMKKLHIVARANSVRKVVAAVYAIIGYCFTNGTYIKVIEPSQWQQNRPKESKLNSKKWSVQEANRVLDYLKAKRKLKLSEDHTADAINIGIQAIQKYRNKEWVVPALTDNE